MDGAGHEPPDPGQPTIELVNRYRDGDNRALEILFERYNLPLRRFAQPRMPRGIRGMLDTDDLVQDVLMRTVGAIDGGFEPRGSGALFGYMRLAVKNRIVDEVRKVRRRPALEEVGSGEVAPGASQLEVAIGLEKLDCFEKALAKLSTADRRAVVARMEFGLDYDVIAQELDRPSRDAARMAVKRALVRLAKEMDHVG